MLISIDRNSSIPIYLQIRNQIREMIVSGLLPAGYKLPPERKLAQTLGVNRSTVLNAYRDLKADGLVDSHVGQGTIVSPTSAAVDREKGVKEPGGLPWQQFFSDSMSVTRGTLVRDLLEFANRDDIISFAAGVSTPGLDPVKDMERIQRGIIKSHGCIPLQHTPTEGHYPLRESIRDFMRKRGITASVEEIMILSGSQQGLDLASRIFIEPGDVVLVEEPTFFCALQIFKSMGARIIGVPMDNRGIRTDILEPLLKRHSPKFIYTVPTFQNPTGITMDLDRRKQLLNMAYRHQVPIIEDDPYIELRYEGKALPPLKALDQYGYVIYLSSFSKLMFPGLRVGWIAAPREIIHQFMTLKQMADLHSSSLPQWIFDRFIRERLLERHIDKIRSENLARRDIMLEALDRYTCGEIEWNRPDGGLYIWCRLPEGISQSRLMVRAMDHKVAFVPGDVFYPGIQTENCIRLNFTYSSPEKIREGVKRLIEVVAETMKQTREVGKNMMKDVKPII